MREYKIGEINIQSKQNQKQLIEIENMKELQLHRNRLFLIVFYSFLGLNPCEIARMVQCHDTTVRKFIKRYKLPKKQVIAVKINLDDSNSIKSLKLWRQQWFLVTFYSFLGLTKARIAKIAGTTKRTVNYNIHKFRIPSKEEINVCLSLNIRVMQLWRNKLFLITFYSFLGFTKVDIARIAECGETIIRENIKKFKLPTQSERTPMYMKPLKLYRNRLFLTVFYNFLNLSLRKIAKIAKCSWKSVHNGLNYHNLDSRSQEQALAMWWEVEAPNIYTISIPITPDFRQILIGALLGDGTVANCTYIAYFSIGMKYDSREYLCDYIRPIVEDSGYSANTYPYIKKDGNITYQLLTNGSLEIKELHTQWYRRPTKEELKRDPKRKWVKKLPDDFSAADLTPPVCLSWWCEDGSVSRGNSTTLIFCTQGFSLEENKQLAQMLREVLQLPKNDDDVTVKNYTRELNNGEHRTYYFLRLKAKAKVRFIQYIGGKSPVKCFEYKFDLRSGKEYYIQPDQ